MFTSIYRVYGEKGRLEIEAVGDKLRITVIDAGKALDADVAASSFFEALFNLVVDESEAEDTRLLMQRRSTCYYDERCSELWVPDTSLVAHTLYALRSVLAKAPARPIKRLEEECSGSEEDCYLWSPEEARAAAKAAILLDLAAMLLRSPETVDKLPRDVDMLVKSYEENHSLDQFLKPRTEARAAEG